jgi:hypothetical protein
MSLSDAKKIEILYNKNIGVVTTYPGATVNQQKPNNTLSKIIPELQIFNQTIPSTAPEDLEEDEDFRTTVTSSSSITSKRYVSRTYHWIVKYENVQLTTAQFRRSFDCSYNGVNLLSQTIPYNYDPTGSYNITVRLYNNNNSNFATNNPSDSTDSPQWYYDKDAGFITFYYPTDNTNRDLYLTVNPIMTFWRYEGTFGISNPDSGITGPTGSFQDLIVKNQITASGGITGPTGSFQDLIVKNQITASGGITGPTGSFQDLIVKNQITASGGITGPTGSFQDLIIANQIIASAGITGATGSFTFISSSSGITGPTGSFQDLIVANQIIAPKLIFPDNTEQTTAVISGTTHGQALNWNGTTQKWQITGDGPLAFGNYAGQENQSTAAIAIGIEAGRTNQNSGAIAIGFKAGQFDQGENSIAIGNLAGPTGQAPNSIVLNASGSGVTGGATGFFVSPIRNITQTPILGYDTSTNEITYYTTTYANDNWLLNNVFNNLLGQPPSIVFNPYLSTSTSIYISWKYPTQKKIGLMDNTLVPRLETFSLYVNNNSANYYVVNNTTDFISASNPVTMIVLYKNSRTPSYSNTSYNVNNTTYTGYAYHVYNPTVATDISSKTKNYLYSWYQNDSTFNEINPSTLEFLKFLDSGAPSKPLNLIVYKPTSTTLDVSYNAPQYADTTNPGQGSIVSYTVKYISVGSSIRYPSPIAFSETTTNVSGTNTTLSGLYPDSSYNVQVAATNNSNLTGGYSDPVSGTTTWLTPSAPITSITFTYNQYSNPSSIRFITSGSTTNTLGTNVLVNNSTLSVTNLTMPIHRVSNRGNLQASSGRLMRFTTNLDGSNSLSIDYQGFGAVAPSGVSNPVISMASPSVIDNYSASSSFNQGFYLNARMNMTIQTSQIVDGPTLHTVNFDQSFNLVGEASSSGSFSFYYTTPVTSAPTVTLSSSSFGISSTYFRKISGINVMYSNPIFTIDASASNMGTYFYRTPLLTYTLKRGTTFTTAGEYNESDLSKVNKPFYYPSNVLLSTIVFNSSFTVISSYNLVSYYFTQLTLDAVANNISGTSNKSTITQNVIGDGPSNTLVYTTLAQSIPTLGTTAAGYRVWSAPSYQNNCPYLTKDNNGTTYYKSIQYNNEWDITSSSSTPGNYNVTTELLVSNGLFRTPGSGGYINYSTYLHNTLNYSGISSATGEIRFATFCWKLTQKTGTPSYYQNLSFTINSISTPTNPLPGFLKMNGSQIKIFYLFQDENSSTFSSDVFNSVWIDGNSNNNEAGSGNFYDNTKPYGNYGGFKTSSITSNNATINVYIPIINTISSNTYLYLRLGIPMDVNISFGNVTATIG